VSDLLTVAGLAVAYGAIQAVRALDLRVGGGEIVALLGANGAGKSSTLNAIVGLVPARGRIVFQEREILGLPTEAIVRRGLSLVPEGRHVFPSLTVDENLTLGGAVAGRAASRTQRAEMLTLFPILAERERQLAGSLSGGEQQQLAIARALMSRPQLLLLDEPSLGLAPQIVETIFALIERLRAGGLTVLLVEQNVAMALEIADRGYVMAQGRVAMAGPAAELRASAAIERAYLGASAA
jgi:branched-chain amino acid transport system ATP-binding protein